VRCNLGLTSEFAEPRSPAVVVDWQLAVARVNHPLTVTLRAVRRPPPAHDGCECGGSVSHHTVGAGAGVTVEPAPSILGHVSTHWNKCATYYSKSVQNCSKHQDLGHAVAPDDDGGGGWVTISAVYRLKTRSVRTQARPLVVGRCTVWPVWGLAALMVGLVGGGEIGESGDTGESGHHSLG
jgi:hypothetical protein